MRRLNVLARVFLGCMLCLLSTLGLSVGAIQANEKQSGNQVSAEHGYLIRIDTSKPVLKLYFHGELYQTYAVALGKDKTETPIGSWTIVDKQTGWGSGFGTRWMGLNVPWGTFGIHGTNRPESIGTYASNGCIRMLNEDVEQLYNLVPKGTEVVITGNPIQYHRMLELGNIGADVRWVQQRLQRAGYFRGVCNGRFEYSTQFALLYFELSRGIPMDGVVGVDDYEALSS